MYALLMNTQNISSDLLPIKHMSSIIFIIRDQRVMLSSDLAKLYQVDVRTLMQAVKRNLDRFPEDFMFQLTQKESSDIVSRSQIVILKQGHNIKYRPYAFTEQGVAMLSSVLRSEQAVKVNIEIMRAFVKLRQLLQTNAELALKLKKLERKYNGKFNLIFKAIYSLMQPPEEPIPEKGKIGFNTES
jgi:hypothetical protein